MPELAFAATPQDEADYDKFFYFHRADTSFAEAYADIKECDALSSGISYYGGDSGAAAGAAAGYGVAGARSAARSPACSPTRSSARPSAAGSTRSTSATAWGSRSTGATA